VNEKHADYICFPARLSPDMATRGGRR
jgi:hypothetical protein